MGDPADTRVPQSAPAAAGRPPVSVVVPFHGSVEEARALSEALGRIELRAGDEIIVADNTVNGAAASAGGGTGVQIVPAPWKRSSYYARNVGAENASNDWLLFLDADCMPSSRLLDSYFADPPGPGTGAVAGEVVGAEGQDGLIARYSRSRRHLDQAESMRHPYKPLGVTANLLVRREAWASVGGFLEGIRSAGDSDFSWRIQDAGWELEYRADAAVHHRHREDLRGLARQMARYGAGRAWLRRRHPGSRGRPRPVRGLARSLAGVVIWTISGRFERARFKALDAVSIIAESAGYLLANTPPGAAPSLEAARGDGTESLDIVVLCDLFPELSETFIVAEIKALQRAGHRVRVEAWGRSRRPNREPARGIEASYLEDDGVLRRMADLVWLAARHPLRCLRDFVVRQSWRREEEVRPLATLAPLARRIAEGGERHLHAHFAAGAALDALRVSRLLRLPYSVTAHAYDIFHRPRNLRLKLERSAFVTTGCRYNVTYLTSVVRAPHDRRIHEIVMGVDGDRFRREHPYPGGRTVVAVGRLVDKKGFAYLIEATALLERDRPLDAVRIVGEGALRGELEALVRRLGLEHRVQLLGALDPDEVRDVLQGADVLAMPCVIAPDGDRDSMPVVVKEALAMEIPVVATDEVGLPEVVRPDWGRLVPPRDAEALADALDELLSLPVATRTAMGRQGRLFVLEHCSVDGEASKLAELIRAATAPVSARA